MALKILINKIEWTQGNKEYIYLFYTVYYKKNFE